MTLQDFRETKVFKRLHTLIGKAYAKNDYCLADTYRTQLGYERMKYLKNH